MVVREERGLWREQNIHDRCNNYKPERSKTTTSVPALFRISIEQARAMEKFGYVKGTFVEEEVVMNEGVQCSYGLAWA